MSHLTDLLIRDLASDDAEYLRQRAMRNKTSLSEAGKELIREARARDRAERDALWERIARIREAIGPLREDSTDFIREWRERR
jgi:hypothetical protein